MKKIIIMSTLVLFLLAVVGWASPRAFTATTFSTTTPVTVTFDFDTGLPVVSTGQPTPFGQTSGGVTARFSSPSDPAAFSVQSYDTTFFKLSQFSGKYLYDNKLSRDYLDIKFNLQLTSITLTFATIETDVEPSKIKLTAYMDSTGTTPVGSASATGTLPPGDAYPQGTLSFDSMGQPFNLVRIELVPLGHPYEATNYFVDNVIVTTAPTVDTTPPVTTMSLSGTLGNQGWYTSDVTISLSATDDMSEVNKTEYSFDKVTWTTYATSFTVTNEGTTIVYYRSNDTAGNAEAVKTQTVKIDKTVPTGSIVINNNNASTSSASVMLTVTSNDTFSGVSQVRYSNDGTWDTEQWEAPSPTKTWTLTAGNGTKIVYYQIKDNAGLVSLTYQDSIIVDTTKPTAQATASPTTVQPNTAVSFDGRGSTDNVGVVSYTWNFGDGSATATGATVTHQYTQSGTYTVTLTVKDAANNSNSKTLTITVEAPDYTMYYVIGAVATIAIIAAVYFLLVKTRS